MVGSIKHIIVIQSLFDEDKKSGKELYDDIISRMIDLKQEENIKMSHEYFDTPTKESFIEILRYIEAKAQYIPGGVLIHLEIHGSEKVDGLVLSDRKLIKWKELIALFRDINIKTRNQLYITMATCFGRQLYEGVDPNEKCPYSGYISASKKVKTQEVIENFSELFIKLIEDGNLIKSYLDVSTDDSNFFYKDSKETFRLLMEETKNRMFNDPAYKEEIFKGTIFNNALDNGLVNQKILDAMMFKAYDDIYRRHKAAFDFLDVT